MYSVVYANVFLLHLLEIRSSHMICLSYTRPPDLSKKKNLFRLISANKQINTEIWNLSLSLTQRFKKFSISYFLWDILTKTLTTKNMGLRSNPRRTFFTLSLLSILVFLLFTSFALAQVSLSLSLSLSLSMHICGVCWWLWLCLLWILGVRAWYWQGRVYQIQRSGSP